VSASRPSAGFALTAGILLAGVVMAGCSSAPNQANILLRKENQQLTGQIATLQVRDAGLEAQIRVDQSRPGTTIQSLPEDRLEQLFTAHGLTLGKFTNGDGALRVYAVPIDEQGQPIKAAGAFKVELFDLAEVNTRLGTWDFSIQQARDSWLGSLWFYTYQLTCPWQKTPGHSKLLVHVTFTDALTGRVFTADKDIDVTPPTGQQE
jgi:hypothetical protein